MAPLSEELDEEGFLIDPQRWNPKVAELIARSEGIVMEELEWDVIHSLRNFHAKTDVVPLSRAFVKLVREEVDSSIGNSLDLMKIFGQSPAKTAAKIAGLPKNSICI
tara:strand:- start:307 stop:627 length:321 start_codon:yes stop_codon:yes gene_type:complete